jgi:glutamyl-tRNA reductase
MATAELTVALQDLRPSRIAEAFLLSTCNRVEVYVTSSDDKAAEDELLKLFATSSGVAQVRLEPIVVIRHETASIEHLFAVACGLDSMALGETEIVSQLRAALRQSTEAGIVGPQLSRFVAAALRVSKKARSETSISRSGRSLVEAGLTLASQTLDSLAGKSALVIGAGSMAMMSGMALRAAGVTNIVVVSRTTSHAQRVATRLNGAAKSLSDLRREIASADIVIAASSAPSAVLTRLDVERARSNHSERPLFLLDLGLPRNVDPEVSSLAGVELADINHVGQWLRSQSPVDDVALVQGIIATAVADLVRSRRQTDVEVVIVALRQMAAKMIDSEIQRLRGRLPDLNSRAQDETERTIRRAVSKILHTPTVRAKQFSDCPNGVIYLNALSKLFDLDISEVAS